MAAHVFGRGCRTARAGPAISLLAVTALWSLPLASRAAAEASGSDAAKATPGLSLFHEGHDALAWDNDELTRVRTLHSKDFSNEAEFLGAPNLASYLGLSPVDAVHLPVPLSILLVGFAADGNMAVNVSLDDVNNYFEHLDHILPHTRIDHSEITCQEDGQCAGLVHGRFQPTPMPSYVHLNFSCNVVVVRKRAVVDAFERAISAFSRPVDPAIETGAQQVDATKMEAFVDHFIGSLGLESYTLLVLNPTWHVDEPVYGYRTGMSAPELALLMGQAQRVQTLQYAVQTPEPELPPRVNGGQWNSHRSSWYYGMMSTAKFSHEDATRAGDEWVNQIDTYLKQEGQYRAQLLAAAGKDRGAAAVVQAARLLVRPNSAIGGILHKELIENWQDSSDEIHSRFSTAHPAEDCLVNTWVGSAGRWALVDLTAGGKDWGPALGGDGVVHYHTLPHVQELFAQLKSIKDQVRQNAESPGSIDQLLKDSLQRERSSRIPAVANKHYHAYMMRKQEALRQQSGAPGSSPDDSPVDHDYMHWRRQYRETLLQAELDLLEEFALRHCHEQANPPLMCGSLREDVLGLRAQLSKLHAVSGSGSGSDLGRHHKWDIFGDDPENMHEVHFTIHLITDSTRATARQVLKPGSVAMTSYFDVGGYKAAVDSLRLYNQGFSYSVVELALHDEPALAAAVAAATKTTSQEIPSSAEYIEAEMDRVYIDSRELAHDLRLHFDHHAKRRAAAAGRHTRAALSSASREVPVYVLQLDRDVAVLLDEHYNARALDDMILVVANAARRDEHPTGMMCGGTLVSRPLSPLKEALAATLLHLGGVLPPHLGYNPRSHTLTHDWLWSTGSHCHSFTSAGVRYSALQKDALARAYLLDALDTSIDAINHAIGLLMRTKPSRKLHAHIKESSTAVRDLLRVFNDVVSEWRSIASLAYVLDFTTALEYLPALEGDVDKVVSLAEAVALQSEPLSCAGGGGYVADKVGLMVPLTYIGSAVVTVLAMLYAAWPRLWAGQKAKAY